MYELRLRFAFFLVATESHQMADNQITDLGLSTARLATVINFL